MDRIVWLVSDDILARGEYVIAIASSLIVHIIYIYCLLLLILVISALCYVINVINIHGLLFQLSLSGRTGVRVISS
jgi:hypothetical protein